LSVFWGVLLGCLTLLQTAPGAEPLCLHFDGERECDPEQAVVLEPAFATLAQGAGRIPPESTSVKPESVASGLDGPELSSAHDPWELGLTIQGPPAALLALSPTSPAYEVHDRPEVRRELQGYLTGERRVSVAQLLDRSGRYIEMIQAVLRDHGLPEDLFATVIIESGLNPAAVSRAGARGLWQFMAATARRYGLRVDHWVDERLDPEKSTRAAARYLRDLYAMFGSWPLVHAAYNGGEGRVSRAIQALRTMDFWEIAQGALLAEETKKFVASVQAAALIVREPERYGFALEPHMPTAYRTVEVPPGTTLAVLARRAGVQVDVLHELNPELQLGQTPPDQAHQVKVPGHLILPVRVTLERDSAPGKGKSPRKVARTSRPVRRDVSHRAALQFSPAR
jgi:membrane-bound lytic murein transglycosylase D